MEPSTNLLRVRAVHRTAACSFGLTATVARGAILLSVGLMHLYRMSIGGFDLCQITSR
jgi:hypothetical protein